MIFDGTINLAHILTILVIIASGIGTWFALRNDVRNNVDDLKSMAARVSGIEAELKKLTEILVQVAVQDQRLNEMDRRISELQHGEGFVLPHFRRPEP